MAGVRGFAGLGLRLVWPAGPGAFRLWLALLVFAHHLSSFGLGPFAVYVFFALSGFWLQRMWTKRYRHARAPFTTYLLSRWWRLAPVMLLVSALTIPFLLAIDVPREQVLGKPWHLAASSMFLLGYAWLDYLPVGSAWSLDVEAQFYLLVPLLAAAMARGRTGAWLTATAAISLASSLLLVTPILPKYVLFFAAGMLAAREDWQPSERLAKFSAAAWIATLAAITLSPWRDILWGGSDPGPLYAFNPAFNVVMSLVLLPFALGTVHRKGDNADAAMGDLSYIVYVLHWAAMQWFFMLPGGFAERVGSAIAAIAVVLLLSLAVWKWFDRPVNLARTKWVRARMQDRTQGEMLSREPAGP